ncbi:hypothetical protein FGM00_02790 [Aggregatimonas sangjinii]|uniref:Uncharacterized protein n=2 Tax=Aggregatimonas sangjinii TaxID=2583587 RepID=A0A5B7SYH9_9FLAO|nr:hypothetical protein FGM00_02790 [Aggregatimonas sangjinii]
MKGKFYFIALLLIAGLSSSCEKDDSEYQNDFEDSRKAWLDFKESTNNSYKYIVVGGSWVGFSWETTLTVSNGKLIGRHFKYTVTEGLAENVTEEELEWTENEAEIGTHEFVGADALTLDEIYDKAQREWLKKRENAKIYFETKNNGMISTCGYVENGCADDCFIGVTINSIEKL